MIVGLCYEVLLTGVNRPHIGKDGEILEKSLEHTISKGTNLLRIYRM
jgi:hypothetical protein